jgi:S1-C subfamily serine protease
VNVFDIFLIVIAVSAAIGGYRLGFVARATSWLGLALGLVAGAFLLRRIVPEMQDAGQATKSLVAVGLLVGAALIGMSLGLVLGSRLYSELPPGAARRADRAAGGVIGVVGVLVGLWLLLPVLAHVPGLMSEQARGSAIAREVSDRFPDPPDTLAVLRRFVGDEPFPQVFDALRPAPDAGTAPEQSGLSTAVANQVVQSTVKVTGEACSRIQEGSGFFVGPDLVVTNAHVVAGESGTEVELADGRTLDAAVVAFDPERDLAVLRTDGEAPALSLRDADTGDVGGVFGHPGGGGLEVSPFRVAEQITAVGRDIYDQGSTSRDVLVLASDLAPGDSGSALVDPQGQVVGVAFAVAPDKPGVAYALAISELREVLERDLSRERDTGGCLV